MEGPQTAVLPLLGLIGVAYRWYPVIPTHHQYAAVMSPSKGKTVVCGSSIFVRDDGGDDHWFPFNRVERLHQF